MNTVNIRCDAGGKTGLGHVVRCLALADELTRRGCQCTFVGNDDMQAWVAGCKRKEPLIVVRHPDKPDEERFNDYATVTSVEKAGNADVWIVDKENGCPPSLARQLREMCKVLVILNGVGYNDTDEGRLIADLVFYQGCTRRPYDIHDWTGFDGEWFEGPDWIILRPNFHLTDHGGIVSSRPRILVAGGGSDKHGIAALAAWNLHVLCDVRVIVGPFSEWDYPSDVELIVAPKEPFEHFAWADMAVISYGMTAFECLAAGLPTLAISITPDHEESAGLVERESRGALLSLGQVADIICHPDAIIHGVIMMMQDFPRRRKWARHFVDGLGAERVADRIMRRACLARARESRTTKRPAIEPTDGGSNVLADLLCLAQSGAPDEQMAQSSNIGGALLQAFERGEVRGGGTE